MMINKRLINEVPEAQRLIKQKVILSCIAQFLSIVFYWSLASIMYEVFKQEKISNSFIIVAVITIICRYYLTKKTSLISGDIAGIVKLVLREKIYTKLLAIGDRYKPTLKTAEVVQLSSEGIEQMEVYFSDYIPQLLYAAFSPIILFVIYATLSIKTAVALFVCVPLIPISIVVVQKVAKKILARYWGKYMKLSDNFLENLQGLTTLKIYSADKYKHEQMNKEAEEFRKITMRVLTMQLNSITVMDIVAYGGTAVGMLFIASDYLKMNINIGQAIFMITLASEFFLSMRLLGSFFHIAMNSVAASERLFKLLDLKEDDNKEEVAKNGDISLENITFSYKDIEVIKDVDMNIKKGEFISIVGESGCGKTTLSRIISSRIKPGKGSVKINDVDINKVANLSQILTVVSLESYIFKGTIRQNLLMGNKNASDSELLKVLEKVNLTEYIEQNSGLETLVSEGGSNLSGGQKQKINIARALLKNSNIYILDEATSAIDRDSTNKIIEILQSLKGEHTIIQISHRLKNVVPSDRIYVMKDGKIKEIGNHKELMDMDGIYNKLYTYQSELEYMGENTVKERVTI